jgi:hypothetical protein
LPGQGKLSLPWYTPTNVTNFVGEIVIPESTSAEETVRLIKQSSGL